MGQGELADWGGVVPVVLNVGTGCPHHGLALQVPATVSFPALVIFFADDFVEAGVEVGLFGGVEGLAGVHFAHGFGFAGEGGAGGVDALIV